MKFVVFGIVVHSIFLASVFDVYFNSPVIQGIKGHYPSFEPAANRLVLIVADGLRASTLYKNHLKASPYLRGIVEKRGSWGVSHTRVPTESRPGHVALIAGLYEDPSAVTKGWKENPVQFDSVFNRSLHTWAWGSPDIIPMFAKGEAAGKVTTYCYPATMQEFSGDGSNEKLDLWVLEKFLSFFNETNDFKALFKKGNIFFLHFLGIDTAGHATKPHSRQYIDNIKLVDSAIQKVEDTVNTFFNDNNTAFIFTSDHGMTDWGSHGAGLPDETETPLIVWGAGFSGPLMADPLLTTNNNPLDWGLSHLQRRDVQQADIAALMSALLAIPTPTNNVGLLPHVLLSVNNSWKVQALLSNAHQMILQLERAQEIVHDRLFSIFLRPFSHSPRIELNEVEKVINAGEFNKAIEIIEKIQILSLQGMSYYQEYFGKSLKWVVTGSHFLWLLYLMKSILVTDTLFKKQTTFIRNVMFILSVCGVCLLILVQRLPLQYMIYYSLPIFLLWSLCENFIYLISRICYILEKSGTHLLILVFMVLIGVTFLVLSFYHRSSLSLGLIFITMWPLSEIKYGAKIDFRLCALWVISCTILSVFPLLPVIGREANYSLVLTSGLLVTILGFFGLWKLYVMKLEEISRLDVAILTLQTSVIGIAAVNVFFTALHFDAGFGLLWYHQVVSWLIFVVSCLLPGFTGTKVWVRVPSVWLSLMSILLLLSVNHEPLFLLALLAAMSVYPAIEIQLQASESNKHSVQSIEEQTVISYGDLRRAYFYLFFTVLAFFGLGNVASLNSFDPAWVRCLITTFAPYLMGVLLLMKILIPFLVVACGIFVTAQLTKRPVQWLLVLAICDTMALPFFHLIVTQGSWLDIGQSISHFVIAHVCILMLLLLRWAAKHWLCLSWIKHKTQSVPSLEMAPKPTYKTHGE